MDMAILNHRLRPHYLSGVNGMVVSTFREFQMLDWIISRNVIPQEVRYTLHSCYTQTSLCQLLHHSRTRLKTLSLGGISDPYFQELSSFPALTSFRLSCFDAPTLNSLGLGYVRIPITPESIVNFCVLHPQLQEFSLNFADGFTSEFIVSLVSKCPNLKKLCMSYNKWFDDECVTKLVQGNLDLLSLDLSSTSVRQKESIELILNSFPNLHSFTFRECGFSLETNEFCLRQVAIPSLLDNDPKIQSMGLNCIFDHFDILRSSECREFPIDDETFSSIAWGVIPILNHSNQVS
jgi:hypothetical protein